MSAPRYASRLVPALVLAALVAACTHHALAGGFGPAQGSATGAADGDSLGDLTPTDGNIAVGDGAAWVAESGATARTSLGLGTGDSPTFTAAQIGSADTSGAKLDMSGGVLRVRKGDGSAAAYISALRFSDSAATVSFGETTRLGSAVVLGWASTTNLFASNPDMALSRLGDGQLAVKGGNAQSTNVRSVTTASSALSGATVTLASARPAGSIIVGITLRVTTAVTSGDGGTAFTVGDGSDADRYGAGIAFTLGTTTTLASHTASPLEWLGAAGDVVLTCTGGTFSGGVVRISVHYLDLTAPGS